MAIQIDNNDYGMFLVSDSVLAGLEEPCVAYRNEPRHKGTNGWMILDRQTAFDMSNATPARYCNAVDTFRAVPIMYELFDCKYGTSIQFDYEDFDGQQIMVGLYDLEKDCETDIDTLLNE